MVLADEHIVVVEDGAELHLDQDRGDGRPWHALTTAVPTISSIRQEGDGQHLTMFDLVRHALRFQPDRLILGESRGEEMAAVCKALDDGARRVDDDDPCGGRRARDRSVGALCDGEPRFAGNERLARRIVEQAVHVVVHIANQEGRRRVTGVVAVERGGNHKWVYRQGESGGLIRTTDLIGNLGRLAPRLREHLRGVRFRTMTIAGGVPEPVILTAGIASSWPAGSPSSHRYSALIE